MCPSDDKIAIQSSDKVSNFVSSSGESGNQQSIVYRTLQKEIPATLRLVDLITSQAHKTPDAIALSMNEQVLTYAELNQRANQVAHLLRLQGVGPEVLVACCIERSPAMVVGLLGILKAGGAYLPLNPLDPRERLAFLLTDSNAHVLLTQQKFLPRFSSQQILRTCIEQDTEELAHQPIVDIMPSTTETDLAYVIYTSGSTGQPKGVEITHAGLLNLIYWHQYQFGITAYDRATQLSNPAFDATGWEIWPYLTIGARIFFPDEDVRVSPVLLRNWLVDNRITVTFLPTPLAEYMMALQWPSATPLRLLLTGADTLHRYPAVDLPFTVINNYGPTEATVVTTSGCVEPLEDSNQPPSIGRPIANAQVYILDEQLQPVPIGAAGELYIGGAGLARGYRNRPMLTKEKFIPSPFDTEAQAYLYKTGDLVRCLPDGRIAFMGRIDRQVKIHGFRIELGEIEATLNRYTSVLQSAVVIQEDALEDKRLLAYVVMRKPTEVAQASPVPPVTEELHAFLSSHLPTYMIPTTFIVLDALPLTANGKVDREALPAPKSANADSSTLPDDISPSIEAQVEGIVANLLGMQQVDREENIFLLGGHSLLGTQIITQINKLFGVHLHLRTLFNAPTVQQLSSEIERRLVAS